MNTDIAQQLLRGSQNIDRMKSEVHQVIRMVIGLAQICREGRTPKIINETFKSETCVWEVKGKTVYSSREVPEIFSVQCHTVEGVIAYSISGRSGFGAHLIYTSNVHLVHADLHTFVEGMLRTLPELAEEWKPLIKAADRF